MVTLCFVWVPHIAEVLSLCIAPWLCCRFLADKRSAQNKTGTKLSVVQLWRHSFQLTLLLVLLDLNGTTCQQILPPLGTLLQL